VILAAAGGGARGATASPQQAGILEVASDFGTRYKFDDAYCRPGAEPLSQCVQFTGTTLVPGLGRATSAYVKVLPPDDPGCPVIQFDSATIEIAGKGTIEVGRQGRACGPTAPASVGPFEYTVTGGTGAYAGAAGRLVFRSTVGRIDFGCNCGVGKDSWTGTISVPGMQFDVTAPTLAGAASKTVRVPRGVKRARVQYAPTAVDDLDGSVPVSCTPPSGSFFALGRSRVACSAVDSSGNTGEASFWVTVKRRA
jgi:hypothetical protein